ncbi:MAG: nucleoside-diphosphate kinase [Anaerolinea sp.]|nr:nucleoside-diphosphate kinase [Anaerolinea sp.]
MERTLILIKPDGVQRGLIGEIIKRLEARGLKIIGAKFMKVDQKLAETHYQEHVGKPFYPGLLRYICSSPVMAMVWEGRNAVAVVRQTMGKTNPSEAAPGTIRHDFALYPERNLTHSSDKPERGEEEVSLWFKPEELVEWDRNTDDWIYSL